MNRLAIIATTGALALMLTACGDKGSSKPAAQDNSNAAVVQPAETTVAPAHQDAAPATPATPATPAAPQSEGSH